MQNSFPWSEYSSPGKPNLLINLSNRPEATDPALLDQVYKYGLIILHVRMYFISSCFEVRLSCQVESGVNYTWVLLIVVHTDPAVLYAVVLLSSQVDVTLP